MEDGVLQYAHINSYGVYYPKTLSSKLKQGQNGLKVAVGLLEGCS